MMLTRNVSLLLGSDSWVPNPGLLQAAIAFAPEQGRLDAHEAPAMSPLQNAHKGFSASVHALSMHHQMTANPTF